MERLHHLVFFVFIFWQVSPFCQEHSKNDGAYEKYQELSATMAASFPQDDFKTYKRTSFTQRQLELYLSQYFQRLDLLPLIENRPDFVLDAYLHSGNWFQSIGFYKESITSYNHFFQYYEAHHKELSPEKIEGYIPMISYAYGTLAENYTKLNYMDSATTQYLMNIRFNDTLSIISQPSAINNYGLFFYTTKKDLDSALIYFKKAYDITQRDFPTHTLNASIRDNIADIYTDRGRYAEAKILYEDNFKFYKTAHSEITKTRDISRLISAGSQLVETNLRLKDQANAQLVFSELDSIVNDAASKNELMPDSKLEFLLVKENLYKSQGNMAMAYKTLTYSTAFSDSLARVSAQQDSQWHNELNAVTIDRVVLKAEMERIEKDNKIQSQTDKLWISSLVSSVIIILLFFLFLGRRQHLINAKNKELLVEQQLENERLKVDQLHSEIQSKQRDLSDFALNLSQNQKWATLLSSKIKMLKTANTKDRNSILKALELDIKNKIQFDRESQVFYEHLDKLNDAFYTKLMNLFPKLTKNEIRICSLIRLKMDSCSIATFQNITQASLNTSRYRMRKKMHLDDTVNLDDFIRQL